jgi:hypothetical protein
MPLAAILLITVLGCGGSSSDSVGATEGNGDSKSESVNKEDADWGIRYTLRMDNPDGDDSKTVDLEFANGPSWNDGIPAMVFQTEESANHPVFQYWNEYYSGLNDEIAFPSEGEVTIIQFGGEQYTEIPSSGAVIAIPREISGTGTYKGRGGELFTSEGSMEPAIFSVELEIDITEYSEEIVKGTFSGTELEETGANIRWDAGEFVCYNAGTWDASVLKTSSESEEDLWDRLPGWASRELNSQLNSTYNGDFEFLRLNNVREISPSHYEVTVTLRVGSTVNQISLPLQR